MTCPQVCWTERTHEDGADRCQKPATCRYYNGLEWIPLWPEHYDLWCSDMPEHFDPSLGKWEAL